MPFEVISTDLSLFHGISHIKETIIIFTIPIKKVLDATKYKLVYAVANFNSVLLLNCAKLIHAI